MGRYLVRVTESPTYMENRNAVLDPHVVSAAEDRPVGPDQDGTDLQCTYVRIGATPLRVVRVYNGVFVGHTDRYTAFLITGPRLLEGESHAFLVVHSEPRRYEW